VTITHEAWATSPSTDTACSVTAPLTHEGDAVMSDFLDILALYYLCDATALIRPMSAGEVNDCMTTYDAVKAWFAPFNLAAPGTLERHAQLLDGYRGFLDWQQANPDLVQTMRDNAMSQAQGLAANALR
jgi:hypothetical protein